MDAIPIPPYDVQLIHSRLNQSFNHTQKYDAILPDRVLFHLIEKLECFLRAIRVIESTHQISIVNDAFFIFVKTA